MTARTQEQLVGAVIVASLDLAEDVLASLTAEQRESIETAVAAGRGLLRVAVQILPDPTVVVYAQLAGPPEIGLQLARFPLTMVAVPATSTAVH